MAIAPTTGIGFDTKAIPWTPMPTKDGSPTRAWAKLLHLDLERNFVIMLNKVAQGTVLPQHTHLSEAIGFTISGHWSYRDLQLGPDSFGFEPTGTEHAPEYQEETVALIIFLGDSPELLRTKMPDGREIVTTIDTFVDLKKRQEELMGAGRTD